MRNVVQICVGAFWPEPDKTKASVEATLLPFPENHIEDQENNHGQNPYYRHSVYPAEDRPGHKKLAVNNDTGVPGWVPAWKKDENQLVVIGI